MISRFESSAMLNTAPRRFRFAHYLRALCIASLAAALFAVPVSARATQPETDCILGRAESERQDELIDRPDIEAKQAIVVGKDGTVYFERDADAQTKIASITKVMTAILALEHSSPSESVTVDHAAATVGQSSAGLKEGDVLSMEAALRGLMIPSGNDAAMAIAATIGKKLDPATDRPVEVFVGAMNSKAKELGMQSVFTNPHGLDFDGWEADMHASARDVAIMFSYAMKNEAFRALTASTDNVITVTASDGQQRKLTLIERNKILGQQGNIGGKTGGTYIALDCFVGAFSRESGGEIYTVVLGCDGEDRRWADTLALANWYYDHRADYPVVQSDVNAINGSPLVARAGHADWTDKTVDIVAKDPHQTVNLFSLAGDVEQRLDLKTLSGDVKKGQDAGELVLSQQGKEVARVQLVSGQNVDAPSPIEWVLVHIDRLVGMLSGKPATAEDEVVSHPVSPVRFDAVKDAADDADAAA